MRRLEYVGKVAPDRGGARRVDACEVAVLPRRLQVPCPDAAYGPSSLRWGRAVGVVGGAR